MELRVSEYAEPVCVNDDVYVAIDVMENEESVKGLHAASCLASA